jgi:hypothetical protein
MTKERVSKAPQGERSRRDRAVRPLTSRIPVAATASLFALAAPAEAQTIEKPDAAPVSTPSPEGAPTAELERDPATERPLYGLGAVRGEFGTHYLLGGTLALFATPYPGVSLGGSALFAPIVSVPSACIQTCPTPLLWRGMAELRLGTHYAEYRKGLLWFGVGAGITYMSGLGLDPSPVASIAIGGDIRIARALWLEISPKVIWAQMIGPGSVYAYAYLNAGIETGIRVDFAH